MNRIVERMLARRVELMDAYEEIYSSLARRPRALTAFWDIFVHTPVAWSPERIRAARQDRDELVELNDQIVVAAEHLAGLLARRAELDERAVFSSGTSHHVLDLISQASEHNHLHEFHVKEELDSLRYNYGLDYWPTLSLLVEAIGLDAENAEVVANDPATAAATESRKPGLSDYVKAVLVRIEENTVSSHGLLPDNFALSDGALASLVSCALDLDADEIVDASFIKRFRQRQRAVKST
ncbi:hypothetical protein NP856_17100 [Pseudomonas sp. 17391]|uniref:hypothetical protein n=1 Tax=Pseudomonas TaxID=286 RepID=UPI001CEC21A0|nr:MULTISPECIES: hypothetical protein [Pseudomonas]MDD2130880.1 hypothetical protein [Pseudomonas sp. 17391]